jgi:hypothetical protein
VKGQGAFQVSLFPLSPLSLSLFLGDHRADS